VSGESCHLAPIVGNRLIDVTMPDGRQTAEILREKAARCRRLAGAITDREVTRRLLELAKEFEEQAATEEARERCAPP